MPPWVPLAVGALAIVAFTRYATAAVKRGDLADKWGSYFGVRPELVRRIIKNESNNNPDAIRNVGGDAARGGAYGYMQVTYQTALGLADRLESRHDLTNMAVLLNLNLFRVQGASALFDPDVNIMLGTFYLSELLAEFGDEMEAVGAYNRGAAGMRSFLAQGGNPMDLKYVQRVYA